METFVLWVDPVSWRAEWKCATTTSGGQCVMIPGAVPMLMWLVDSWDFIVMVRKLKEKTLPLCKILLYCSQVLLTLTLEEAREEYI